MTDERFEEIAGRISKIRLAGTVCKKKLFYTDLPELVAYVRELRAQLGVKKAKPAKELVKA